MFGFVTASWKELDRQQQARYGAVYCGICRELGSRYSGLSRLCLSYDMAFLALLHMSLYEPEETAGRNICALHPLRPGSWVRSEAVSYAADMNAVLSCFKAKDDIRDEHRLSASWMASILEKRIPRARELWPRQCEAVESCLQKLDALERAASAEPDAAAGCFGELMAELLVLREDLWSEPLRQMGRALGRFIYLADAMIDYNKDAKRGSYNPFLAAGMGKDLQQWEQYLVMEMARCAQSYEKLPLVQDKALLDNILYSGVWLRWRDYRNKEEAHGQRSL